MARILVDRPATLSVTFHDGEEPVDAGAVTVAVTRYDGTVHLASTAATAVTGETGRYTVDLPPVDDIDLLEVTWTSTTAGVIIEEVEVVGARYVDLAALAKASGVSGAGHAAVQYTAEDRRAVADAVEDLVDELCGAFTHRFGRDVVAVKDGTVILREFPVVRVLSATSGGAAVDTAGWTTDEHPAGIIGDIALADGALVDVAYVHGRDRIPADLQRACQAFARQLLLDAGGYMTDRARGIRDEMGVTFLSTPGPDRPTGLPMVDATLNRYARPDPVVG